MPNLKFICCFFILVGIVCSTVLLLDACTKESIQSEKTIYFQNDVLPIFQSNCTQAGCHNAKDKAEGYDLTSYESIMASKKSKGIKPGDYKNSSIYESLVTGGPNLMPANPYNPLSDAQITTIALWIKQGALNNSTTTNVDLNNVTYTLSVKPILDTYCKGCHSSSNAGGNISYEDYTNTQVTANNGKLLGSIQQLSTNYKAMPQGGNKLSDNNIAIIQKWISNGSPNN